ncbi:MAG: hypothetical protein K2F83_03160, partial [Oscillospiraceae bacterium]|nr:hypothetical protein [Oscillospiraceae bacterium]
MKADNYILVSGTRATINTQRKASTLNNSADGTAPSYVTVSCMDETIAVLVRDDATNEYVLRPAGRAEYGTTAVVFKVYEATKDLLGRYNKGEDGKYVYQCVGESILQLEVYPASGMATPMVVSGRDHTLALKSDGTVWAWGSNIFGQLGIATSVNKDNRDSMFTSCGWVSNGYGGGYYINPGTVYGKYYTTASNAQGDSVLTTYAAPQKVLGAGGQAGNGGSGALSNIVQIAAGDYTSYALDANGNVYAWGYNNHGELGNGIYNYTYQYHYSWCHHYYWNSYYGYWYHSTGSCHYLTDAATKDTNAYSPVRVANLGASISGSGDMTAGTYQVTGASSYLSDVVQISAGRDFAVALRADGTVAYWGNSGKYQSLDYIYADFTQNYKVNTQYCHCYGGGGNCYHSDKGAADTVRRFENAMRAGDGTVGSEIGTYINNNGCCIGNFTYYNQSGIFKTTPVSVLGPGGTGRLGDNALNADQTTSPMTLATSGNAATTQP